MKHTRANMNKRTTY